MASVPDSDDESSEQHSFSSDRPRYIVHDYSHLIPPPIPLMPRQKCPDDGPKSYLSLL